VFENRLLRRILGPKRDEITGEGRKLNNEELNDLYSSPNIVWVVKSRMRWAGHVAHMGQSRGICKVLVWKPEGKRPVRTPTHRCEHNIKMDLQEVGYEGMDWSDVAQDRDSCRAVMKVVMNLRGSIKCGEFLQ